MILTLDASVVLKWFFKFRDNEPDVDGALRLLTEIDETHIQLAQPPHFVAEVVTVLARKKPDEAHDDLLDLLSIESRTDNTRNIYATALGLSVRYRHHIFDTLYHAVALNIPGATLITADLRYYNKARGEGQIILLADWSPAS